MVVPIQENDLIEQHRSQCVALSGKQSIGRDLIVPVEDISLRLIEVLVCNRAKLVEEAAQLDSGIGVRINSVPRGNEQKVLGRTAQPSRTLGAL